MIRGLRDGLRAAGLNWGLTLALLGLNLGAAAALAVPLAEVLEEDLSQRDAAQNTLTGFDYGWWSEWSEWQSGFAKDFGPELFGVGFVFRNLELLLGGVLPAGLFVSRATPSGAGVDPLILALGAGYLVLQTFLAGGLLGVLRAPESGWTVRGVLHGSGFYFGRMFRLLLAVLAVDSLVFALNVPFAAWVDRLAREAVSENTAVALVFGRYALLLLALLTVHLVAGYAKAILVIEERSSALLALVSSLGFCLRRLGRTAGHYAAIAALALLLAAVWAALDAAWPVSGYRTQLLSLVLAQALVGGRIFLRLALMGGQVALYRRSA
ncbi:MAG TPA: hypothetical protein VFQ51_05990 [Vicinamibacteria bacterium]|nr:hypothetical protein [Vicinamibacteria bacterium]